MPGRVRSSPPFGSAQGKLRETATGGASRVVLECGWASPQSCPDNKGFVAKCVEVPVEPLTGAQVRKRDGLLVIPFGAKRTLLPGCRLRQCRSEAVK
jgi:hypothetical protein